MKTGIAKHKTLQTRRCRGEFALLLHLVPAQQDQHLDLLLQIQYPDSLDERVLLGLKRSFRIQRDSVMAWRIHGLHRSYLLSHEGPLNGNRGIVQRIDRGNYVTSPCSMGYDLELLGGFLQATVRTQVRRNGWHIWSSGDWQLQLFRALRRPKIAQHQDEMLLRYMENLKNNPAESTQRILQ